MKGTSAPDLCRLTMTGIRFLSFILILAASPAAVAQYYEYDPDDPEQQAPIREGEKAVIPLDTGDPAYNLWQTPLKISWPATSTLPSSAAIPTWVGVDEVRRGAPPPSGLRPAPSVGVPLPWTTC